MPLSISGAGRPLHSPIGGGRRVSTGREQDVELARTARRRGRGRRPRWACARAHERTPGASRPCSRARACGAPAARGAAAPRRRRGCPRGSASTTLTRGVAVVGVALRDRRGRASAAARPCASTASRCSPRRARRRRGGTFSETAIAQRAGLARRGARRTAGPPSAAASRNSAASSTPRVSAPGDRQAVPVSRAQRHAAALRLEPEQPAARRGDADRAGAVGPERGGAPGRRRRRRPSRRSSRRACGRGPTGCASRRRRATRCAASASAPARASCRARPRPRRAAGARPRRPPPAGPPCASEPCAVTSPATSVSSLIAIGTPLSGGASSPRRASAASASASAALGEHDPEGVELRVEPRDPLEAQLGQLARGDLARAHSSAWRARPAKARSAASTAAATIPTRDRRGQLDEVVERARGWRASRGSPPARAARP